MATIKIPSTNGLRQLNLNDTTGELWSSRNIDLFENPGKVKLARPMKQLADDTDLDNELPLAFVHHENVLKVLTGDSLYAFNADLTSFAEDTTSPSGADDAVIFQGQVVISDSTNVDAWDGSSYTTSWWTARGNPSLTSGNHHLIEVVRIGAETLNVADGNQVHAYTGGISGSSVSSVTVELPDSFEVTTIKSSIRKVFIGTYTEESDQAFVYEWDGASTNYIQAYPVGSKAVLAMEIIDNAPLIVTERGEIKLFNNAGFTTVAQFPFYAKPIFDATVTTGSISSNPQARAVHSKGMKRFGNIVYIFTNFENQQDNFPMDERSPNGIWALDLKTFSLTHVYSPNNSGIYGQVTALEYLNTQNGRIYCGLRDYHASPTEFSVWGEDLDATSTNQGYIVSSEIESNTVKDVYVESIIKALMGDNDSVKVKYRTSNDVDLPIKASGTWLDTYNFNTTDDISDVKSKFDSGSQIELEVITNYGECIVAQVTAIEASSSTYQVTIDSSCGIIDGISIVQFDNWNQVPETFTNSDGEIKRLGIDGVSAWSQVKLVITGKNGYPEIRQAIINTNAKEEI